MPTDVTETALLAAVAANRDDDLPRLVYADWLEENGQPERAEFIRLEIDMAKLQPDVDTAPDEDECPQYRPMEKRATELWEKNIRRWYPALAKLGNECHSDRGFPYHVAMSARRFLKEAEDLFRSAPTIVDVMITQLGKNAAALAECPAFEQVEQLDFFETPFRASDAVALFRSSYFHHLKRFTIPFTDTQFGPAGAIALAGCPSLGRLEELDLSSQGIYDRGATAILTEKKFRSLKSLTLGNNGLSGASCQALAKAEHFERLSELDWSQNYLGSAGVATLCQARNLSRLTSLNLSYMQMGRLGVQAIRQSVFAERLETLTIHNCGLGDEALSVLLSARVFRRVKELGISGNTVGPLCLDGLRDNDGWSSLEVLSISNCQLSADGLRLLSNLNLPQLRDLKIGHQAIGDQGLTLLLQGPLLSTVRTLDITRAEITDVGVRYLVENPHLPRLKYVSISDNPLTDAGKQMLRDRFGERGFYG